MASHEDLSESEISTDCPPSIPSDILDISSTTSECVALDVSPKIYEIRASPDKGLGMFANSAITPGAIILKESPLLHLDRQTWVPSKVEYAFEQLSDSDQEKFMSLFSIHGLIEPFQDVFYQQEPVERARTFDKWIARRQTFKTVSSIWLANCMSAGSGVGVFYEASRINHSCIPNASYIWNEKQGVQEIRAVKAITKGDEITITYCDSTFYCKAQRAELLMRQYNFRCSCIACANVHDPTSFAAQSHSRRWQLAQLHRRDYASAKDEVLARLEEISLMEEEGLVNPKLGVTYLRVSHLYHDEGDKDGAVRTAAKALEVLLICMGYEASLTISATEWLKTLDV